MSIGRDIVPPPNYYGGAALADEYSNSKLLVSVSPTYNGLDFSKPDANNNHRVIGRKKKHAASRGFIATRRHKKVLAVYSVFVTK